MFALDILRKPGSNFYMSKLESSFPDQKSNLDSIITLNHSSSGFELHLTFPRTNPPFFAGECREEKIPEGGGKGFSPFPLEKKV